MLKMAIAEIRYIYLYLILGHLLSLGFFAAYLLKKEPVWIEVFPAILQPALFSMIFGLWIIKKEKRISLSSRLPVKPSAIALARLAPFALFSVVNSLMTVAILLLVRPDYYIPSFLSGLLFLTFQLFTFIILITVYKDILSGLRSLQMKVVWTIPYTVIFLIVIFGNGSMDSFVDFKMVQISEGLLSLGWVLPLLAMATAVILSLYSFNFRKSYLKE